MCTLVWYVENISKVFFKILTKDYLFMDLKQILALFLRPKSKILSIFEKYIRNIFLGIDKFDH